MLLLITITELQAPLRQRDREKEKAEPPFSLVFSLNTQTAGHELAVNVTSAEHGLIYQPVPGCFGPEQPVWTQNTL